MFQERYNLIVNSLNSFESDARVADKNNIFPYKNFDFIKENNLLALLIPAQFGGDGLNFYEYQQCIAAIARGCASTASAFNMHCIIIGGLADIPFNQLTLAQQKKILPFVETIFGEVVNNKKVFASATTEPGIGSRLSKVKTHYQKVEGGYILNGTKSFVTMANYADYYMVLANRKPDVGSPVSSDHLAYFIVPREAKGIEVVCDWDMLSMRGTQSHRVVLNDVFVSNDNVFLGMTNFALAKIIKNPHWIIGGYMGVYLGVMEAALNFTIKYLQERSNKEEQTGLIYEHLIQARVADMYKLFMQAKTAIDNAAQLVVQNPGDRVTNRNIYLAKYIVSENATQLTALAMRTCGGMSLHKRFDLERYFRDSICGGLMPAVTDACQLYIGRCLLDVKDTNIW